MNDEKPFWQTTALQDMTQTQWESLCDGCGKCCMSKLIDEDTDELHYTTVACRLFDADSCRCKDYANRQQQVSDCVLLTPHNVSEIAWLPMTCAYRLVRDGQDLPQWHPLKTGDPNSVHQANISMQGRVTAHEHELSSATEYLDHMVDQPL